MSGLFGSLAFASFGLDRGWVFVRWDLLALLFVVWMIVFVISTAVRIARRNRLRELDRERENLREWQDVKKC